MILLWFLLIFLLGFTCGVWTVFKALMYYNRKQQEAEAQEHTRQIIQKAINKVAQSN
jgi:sensor domain CHASE-containing protein